MQFNKAKDLRQLHGSRSTRLRPVAALVLACAILPVTFLGSGARRQDGPVPLTIQPLAIPGTDQLGPFRMPGAWHIAGSGRLFGGYSALLARPHGRLLALSDRGAWLSLPEPGAPKSTGVAMGYILRKARGRDLLFDAEAATTDPAGHVWVSWEGNRAISRFDHAPGPDWPHDRRALPRGIGKWSLQFGGEAMARLPDGRFVVVNEGFAARSYQRRHLTLVFPADPVRHPGAVPFAGQLDAEPGYRPTDMALLPDGRALILLRQLIWPLPLRFSCRIALADPAELLRTGKWTARTIARLDPPLPTDNYEGLAVRPRTDGLLDVWVISDDNQAATQRTILLRLRLDPRAPPVGKR